MEIKKFQYKHVYKPAVKKAFDRKIVQFINEQGEDGWELVSVVLRQETGSYEFFFKMPLK